MAASVFRSLPPLLPLLLLMTLMASALPEKGKEAAGEGIGTTAEKLIEPDAELIDQGVEPIGGNIVNRGGRGEGRQYWSPPCPAGFQKYWSASGVASICFHVSRTKLPWTQARDECERLAPRSSRCFSSLASVLNGAENEFIRRLMQSENVRDHVWIGLNDRVSEGYFSWLDGRPYSYSNFYSYEPNNGGRPDSVYYHGEDCVELMYGHGSQWNDRNCGDPKYYACKAYCV